MIQNWWKHADQVIWLHIFHQHRENSETMMNQWKISRFIIQLGGWKQGKKQTERPRTKKKKETQSKKMKRVQTNKQTNKHSTMPLVWWSQSVSNRKLKDCPYLFTFICLFVCFFGKSNESYNVDFIQSWLGSLFDFTEFWVWYLVLLGFTGFYLVSLGRNRVSSRIYQVFINFTWFYRIQLGIRFY